MAKFGFVNKIKHAWNAFIDQKVEDRYAPSPSVSFGGRQADRSRFRFSNERSIISAIYTRLSVDVASVDFRHVRVDDRRRYLKDIDSGLGYCLSTEANIDQAPMHFKQDIAMTLLDRGIAAIVPIDTTLDPKVSGGYDIKTLRVGEVVQWFARHVTINVYNDQKGYREDITLPKSMVAIVENPMYAIMNERNSTLQRLIHKLNLLDAVDEQSSSGKLDLIIQLPYQVKSEARRAQADQRRRDIEFQLTGNKYGIAYTDGTEKVTQLNRPAENNLLKQVDYLTKMLYSQLGLTDEIMNGTASPNAMLAYYNRTVDPIITAIVEGMRRTFLTRTSRSQGQDLIAIRDPFKLVPITEIAEIADKFTRNEILSSNEIRQAIGYRPSDDPKADQLRNSNMPMPPEDTTTVDPSTQNLDTYFPGLRRIK